MKQHGLKCDWTIRIQLTIFHDLLEFHRLPLISMSRVTVFDFSFVEYAPAANVLLLPIRSFEQGG